ncbi:sugar ABC transporter substrate-binding protein [Moorella naiadis]|uniref:ABC transporter substrate-binding protein n=1 Tax=Moorella naiadis (nom. illeg.) TaxID=3093670 RepID=UPI003D9CBB56
MKKWATIAAISVIAVGLIAGCGGKTNESKQAPQEQAKSEQVQLNIATVNNPDMTLMKELSSEFEKTHPNIKVNFIVLPDDELRQKVTLDASNKAGQFDIATIGPYEVQAVFAKNGWLEPLDQLFKSHPDIAQKYDLDDLIKSIRGAISVDGKLYGLPFYGESSMIYYRKDLFQAKGLTMPEQPTWTQIGELAKKLNDPGKGIYGIVLKGTPMYGQLAPLLTVINSFGARWFDEKWQPQLTSPEFKKAVKFYIDLLHQAGEPGAQNVGFNEGLGLMAQGKAAIWYDATVAAGTLEDPNTSKVVGKIGYAMAPAEVTSNGSHWLYTWALGLLSSSKHKEEAFEFMTWATSKDYIKLVADKYGWGRVPPGTRYSTYKSPEYQKVAPWADITLKSIESVDNNKPTKDPVPYTGTAQLHIPEYAAFASEFGKEFGAMVTKAKTVDEALEAAQQKTYQVMKDAGYIK